MQNTNTKILENKTYFTNLDGFRTIAFLWVFYGHCTSFPVGEKPKWLLCLNLLFGEGDMGVTFFFVLSGFLITHLLISEKERHGKINIKAFYIRRVLRIWPVYYLVVLICIMLSRIDRSFLSLEGTNMWMVGTFLTNFNRLSTDIRSHPLTVLWSVAVEEQFYLMLPLLLIAFRKKILYVFVLLIGVCIWFRIHEINHLRVILFHTVSVSGSLLVGCCCAYLVSYHHLAALFAKLKKNLIGCVYVLFMILHVLRHFIFSAFVNATLMYLLYCLFFVFFILEQNYAENSFFKMKNLKWLTSLGKYTYGLYAYHMIIICLLRAAIPKYVDPLYNYPVFYGLCAVALAASLLFAWLSFEFMEKPFLKLKKNFSV